jgi:hypothetical protein
MNELRLPHFLSCKRLARPSHATGTFVAKPIVGAIQRTLTLKYTMHRRETLECGRSFARGFGLLAPAHALVYDPGKNTFLVCYRTTYPGGT